MQSDPHVEGEPQESTNYQTRFQIPTKSRRRINHWNLRQSYQYCCYSLVVLLPVVG